MTFEELDSLMREEPLKVLEYFAFQKPVWHAQAACRGADQSLFFLGKGGDPRPAKAICDGCPVREQCAEAALSYPDTLGIWGGMTFGQRRQARRTAA